MENHLQKWIIFLCGFRFVHDNQENHKWLQVPMYSQITINTSNLTVAFPDVLANVTLYFPSVTENDNVPI